MAKENKSSSLVKYEDYSVEDAEKDSDDIKQASGNKTLIKMKDGKNRLRFIPALPGKNWKRVTYEHWVDVPGLGQVRFTCPLFEKKQRCRACDIEKKLLSSTKESDQKRAQRFKAGRRVYANVIVRDNEAAGVAVFPFGIQIENALVELRKDEDIGGNFIHPVEGFDILVLKTGQGLETRYAVHPADKGRSCPLSDDAKEANEWIASQHDLEKFVKVYSDEDIGKILNGEKPGAWDRGGGSGKGKGKSIEDEVGNDDEEDEDAE